MALHLKGFYTGISLMDLRGISKIVEEESGLSVSRLAPIVGEYIATHKSSGHLEIPELFEAFDASVIGQSRRTER